MNQVQLETELPRAVEARPALSPLERYMLADDRPGYPRSFVVGLEFAGTFDRDLLQRVLTESLVNEPRLTPSVGRSGLFGYEWRSGGRIGAAVQWVDDLESLDLGECQQLDLRRGQALRIIGVERSGRTLMYFVFHHACCDGTGALAWLGRLYAAYSRAICPAIRVTASQVDPGLSFNLDLTDDLSQRMGSQALAREATWRRAREILSRRPVRLCPGFGDCRDAAAADRIRFPGSVTRVLDNRETRRLKRAARRHCATLNDLLLSAMFRSLCDWNGAHGRDGDADWYRIMAPVDLRTPRHDALPAANLVSCVFVSQSGAACRDRIQLLNAVTRRMQYAVNSRSALIMYNVVRRVARIPGLLEFALRAWRVQATAMVSYVGDAGRALQAGFPRRRGRLQIGNLELTGITASGPVRPGTAANLTAGQYAGELVLNLTLDPHQFSRRDADQLLNTIVMHLLEYADDENPDSTDRTRDGLEEVDVPGDPQPH